MLAVLRAKNSRRCVVIPSTLLRRQHVATGVAGELANTKDCRCYATAWQPRCSVLSGLRAKGPDHLLQCGSPELAQGCPDPIGPKWSAYWGAPAAHSRAREAAGVAEFDRQRTRTRAMLRAWHSMPSHWPLQRRCVDG